MEKNTDKPDPRFRARIAIFNSPNQKKLITNYTVNISTGGVFIETENVLPEDTVLTLKFKLPEQEAIIACQARVAWTNEVGHLRKHDLPPGMGLQFLNLSLDNMHAIRDFLNRGDLVPTW